MRQTQRLIKLADEAGFPVNTPRDPEQRGGVVILDIPDGKEVTKELARREILVDYRPGAGVRIAPHFYTTEEELSHTMESIQAVAGQASLLR